MKKGFTMSEVLITLGIIGVVASLTIPVIISNNQKKVTATKVHKAYSELTNAIKLSEAINGPLEKWSYVNNVQGTEDYINQYIAPYMKISKCASGNFNDNPELVKKCGTAISVRGVNYTLSNGSSIAFVPSQEGLYALVNTNYKIDGISGKDWFYFLCRMNKVLPYGWDYGINREDLLGGGFQPTYGSKIACKNTTDFDGLSRHGCTALLMLDDWEIKDDYPW